MSTPSADQADSDRSVLTNDPIRSVRQLRRLEFVRVRPPVAADAALVLVSSDGQMSTYGSDHTPTRGELVAKNFRTLYEIDLADHPIRFQYELPSAGDAFFFRCEVDVHWRVIDPKVIVQRNTRNVRALIEPDLRMLMTQETRQFAIENNADAEAAVNKVLKEAGLGDGFGLQVICRVRLALDDTAREHQKVLRLHRYRLTELPGQQAVDKVAAANKYELIRFDVDFYDELMQQDVRLWAHYLANNPSHVPQVIKHRREDELLSMTARLEVFQNMLDSERVEDHLLEEPIRLVLSMVKDALATVAGSSAALPSATDQPVVAEASVADDPAPDADDAK